MAHFDDQLIDELLGDCKSPEEIIGRDGLLTHLTKRVLSGELTTHLGYEKYAAEGRNSGNSRNGTTSKTLQGDFGKFRLDVPRDRDGSFEPKIVPKGQSLLPGFDEKILSLYSRGMTTRDIQAHLMEIYGVEVSPTLISNVTSEVMDEVIAWRNRPLDFLYSIVYFDAMFVKARHHRGVANRAVYLGLGIRVDGTKELLGLWIQESNGAKFWLVVLNELYSRGLTHLLVACVDGLKGFPDAIEAVYPKARVQLCTVHMVRNSIRLVSARDRREVVSNLRAIYSAKTLEVTSKNLELFAEKWDPKYPTNFMAWRRHWDNMTASFAFIPKIRRHLYTTNTIESVIRSFRKVIKNRGAFPNDESIRNILFLEAQNVCVKWTQPIKNWVPALNEFASLVEDQFPPISSLFTQTG